MELKQLSLFGEDETLVPLRVAKQAKTDTYEEFVAKFDKSAPKTTDDCYTPQGVYDAVLSWLREEVDLGTRPIVRPFYPGGDFERFLYPANCAVVDNPPFSILTKVVRWYLAHHVDFFLFAPALTLFSTASGSDITYVVCNSSIVYHNKAVVNTGFVTNLFPGTRIYMSSTLHGVIKQSQGRRAGAAKRRIIDLPTNVVTAARLHKFLRGGGIYESRRRMYTMSKNGKAQLCSVEDLLSLRVLLHYFKSE